MKRRDVHVGGRVWLHLCEAPPGLVRGQFVRVGGTVLELDEPGLPPGVRVQLDRTVNGADQGGEEHRNGEQR